MGLHFQSSRSDLGDTLIIRDAVEYELLGEGTCVQGDGRSKPLVFETEFYELKYHWEGNKADQAKEKCLKLCNKYSWCYAAEVILRRIWPNPHCMLVTDRPGFEKVYGSNVKYSPY